MPRLFVAALPDQSTIDALSTLPRPDEPGVRWVPDENLHVTLRFVGEADDGTVGELLGTAPLPRARVELGPRVGRLGPRQLVIPAAGADELAASVRAATSAVGEPDHRRFRGHLTIARTTPGARSTVFGHELAAAFDVDAVALVRSDLQCDGARYTTLATFPTG